MALRSLVVMASRTAAICALVTAPVHAAAAVNFAGEAACQSDRAVSLGGPAPVDRNLLVVRWLGGSNHELAFQDQVILINAGFSPFMAKQARPLGFAPSDIRHASVLLLDHAHGDHSVDVPAIANRLRLKVVGAPVSEGIVRSLGLQPELFEAVSGKDGRQLTYGTIRVEPVLALHTDPASPEFSRIQAAARTAFAEMQRAQGLEPTLGQIAERARLWDLTTLPRVMDEGTLAFVFTFESGYKLVFHGGIGAPTAYETSAAARIGKVDFLIKGYTFPVPRMAVAQALPHVQLWDPAIVTPTHHDDIGGQRYETPVEPFFDEIRAKGMRARGISPLRGAPICIDISSRAYRVG